MRHVLFVDDEPHVLESLRDALRPWRREWRMTFVDSGPAALEELGRQAYDVVVSDMRMPGMDGAALLRNVQGRHPDTVRIVLSGFAEREVIARAATVAHRFMAKPCDTNELARVVERSCALSELARRDDLRRIATGAGHLPATPHLYQALSELLGDADATAADAAAIIGQDLAMGAKVLQLVNSAFFGPRREISRIEDAVVYLGLETVRTLALSAEAFSALRVNAAIPYFSIEELQRQGVVVARVVHQMLSEDGAGRDAAVAAALLHDIGILLLAANQPHRLAAALNAAVAEHRPLVDVERERAGLTHAELGAHLLSLWGFPHDVVEPVAYHHDPASVDHEGLNPAAAVYIASTLMAEHEAADGGPPIPTEPLAPELLDALGVTGEVDAWREIVARECAPA